MKDLGYAEPPIRLEVVRELLRFDLVCYSSPDQGVLAEGQRHCNATSTTGQALQRHRIVAALSMLAYQNRCILNDFDRVAPAAMRVLSTWNDCPVRIESATSFIRPFERLREDREPVRIDDSIDGLRSAGV